MPANPHFVQFLAQVLTVNLAVKKRLQQRFEHHYTIPFIKLVANETFNSKFEPIFGRIIGAHKLEARVNSVVIYALNLPRGW